MGSRASRGRQQQFRRLVEPDGRRAGRLKLPFQVVHLALDFGSAGRAEGKI